MTEQMTPSAVESSESAPASAAAVTELRVEGDIVFQRSVGNTSLADTKRLYEMCCAVYERYGYALVLIDSTRGGMASPEARRYQTDMLRKQIFPSHTAVYGGGLLSRTGVILMMRASELVTGTKIPVDLVADEASARKLLDVARQRFRAEGIAKR